MLLNALAAILKINFQHLAIIVYGMDYEGI